MAVEVSVAAERAGLGIVIVFVVRCCGHQFHAKISFVQTKPP